MQDCKLLGRLLLVVLFASLSNAWADDSQQPAPELSLKTLYHPEHQFDFDDSLPTTHWIGNAESRLLIQRDKRWMEFDLSSGSESEWPTSIKISQQIAQLDGLDADQVQTATAAAVGSMRHADDVVLVKIDNSIAIVSLAAPARWLTRDASAWQNATIDPSGRLVAYTRAGDQFLIDIASGQSHRLTNDGTDTLLDGVLDWTYQEEIFGRGNYKGFWFSREASWLAMMRIDISAIEPYTLASAGADRGLGIVRRYPKAGDPIPHASLWLWDLRQIGKGSLPPPRRLAESTADQQRIITGVWWSPHRDSLVYSISDRIQSWRELRRLDDAYLVGESEEVKLLLREESSTWVEPPADPAWLEDGSLVWRSELPTGRNRLYHIDVGGKVITPFSPADFHVERFAVSTDGTVAVVTGTAEHNSLNQQVYRIDTASPAKLTRITSGPDWHAVDISPDAQWFIDTASSATRPPDVSVQSVHSDRRYSIAQSKLQLRQPLTAPLTPSIKTPDGVVLPALLVRPPTASEQNRCPVVIEVYGGPQARSVTNRWSGKRALYRELLARRGIATLVLDNRSSAGRGSIESWPIHRRVGEIEFQDLMVGVEWLKQQSWVDSDRLAVRGWSFGGFLTLYAMTHSDAFRAGIAGGSVTDWREYDAFYTERYMGLPEQNPAGYDATAPVRAAEKLHGRVLLIHGEADDNVHPSGTLRMAAALQDAGKDFQLMIYPGASHGVTNPKQLWHLQQMSDRFLLRELTGPAATWGLPGGKKRP